MNADLPGALEPVSFGALLKQYRVTAGLSQEALAERARMSGRAISAYERGLRQAPYRDTVENLVRALGLSEKETATLEATVDRRRGPKVPALAPNSTARPQSTNRNNLPAEVTSFVGRQRELVEIASLLEQTRWVTLIGTGGCGKTRLALQVAGNLVNRCPDGVWLVDLAPLADPALVLQAVAVATGVRDEPGQSLLDTLVAALHSRWLLLVLDNCEHLLDAAAHLANALLRGCPHLRILATSRQPFGRAGEVSQRVPSLTAPDPEQLPPIGQMTKYEAIQLFVERARAERPGFTLNNQNALAVAQICRRLDGIPLAIELAAARARVLTVEQITQRLDDRFWVLIGGGHTALPRHQTLRATLDWSYGLLTEPEQALFRRLAVFVGSFDVDAVEAVGEDARYRVLGAGPWGWAELHSAQHPTPGAPSALDLLVELVGKSLVQVDEVGLNAYPEARYRLLETVRQYGRERLVEAGEAVTARRRHRDWYRSLVERAEPELTGPRQILWLDKLEREHDNIRAVIEGSAADPSDVDEGLRMAAALLRLWIVRGFLGEGRYLIATLLSSAAAGPADRQTSVRMAALHAAGFAAYFQGDYAAMGSLADEWLELARARGDERGIWLANDMLARKAMNQGDYPKARSLFEGELAAMRELRYPFGISSALVGLGVLARLQGDYERAVGFCEECLAVSREAGDHWFIGQALSNLGLARYQQGQYGVARKQFTEALEVRRALGDRSGIAWSLINLGDVGQAQGDYAVARTQLEESLILLRDLGDRSGRADALASLGRVALAQRDYAATRAYCVESLVLRRDLGHRLAMPAMLEDLAGLAAAQGNYPRALTLVGAAAALRDTLGAPASPVEQEKIERWLSRVRAVLDEQAIAETRAEGQVMTIDQAVAFALEELD